jgi:NAD(P)H-dependent FMN reductase
LDKISTADVLVVSMAENNGNYSAALKFDWCSRIWKSFSEKPMLLMSTSDGKKSSKCFGIKKRFHITEEI